MIIKKVCSINNNSSEQFKDHSKILYENKHQSRIQLGCDPFKSCFQNTYTSENTNPT